ncbi:MAG: hypothetical protein PHH60_04870 [Candidatus Margulisbacteria bacterium]|nr:hypothetical protein [Candidatus Margulisiibacteriota bacterium]
MAKRLIALLFILLLAGQLLAENVAGTGPVPYNYRVIDGRIHAGGHPLNPVTGFSNTDQQVLAILNYLKSKNVLIIVDLENTGWIQDRYQKLIDKAGMKRLHIPLNSVRVPNQAEWQRIRQALNGPVYIHCKWGADRTGMVIARYLVEEKNYTPEAAYNAVVTGGKYAGPFGGFKKIPTNILLKRFIYQGPK